jgi:hypothetical protein
MKIFINGAGIGEFNKIMRLLAFFFCIGVNDSRIDTDSAK